MSGRLLSWASPALHNSLHWGGNIQRLFQQLTKRKREKVKEDYKKKRERERGCLKEKKVCRSFLCLAFRSKTDKIQPMGEQFPPPPFHSTLFAGAASHRKEGCFTPNRQSVPEALGKDWTEWNMKKSDSVLEPLWMRLCGFNGPLHDVSNNKTQPKRSYVPFYVQGASTMLSMCIVICPISKNRRYFPPPRTFPHDTKGKTAHFLSHTFDNPQREAAA